MILSLIRKIKIKNIVVFLFVIISLTLFLYYLNKNDEKDESLMKNKAIVNYIEPNKTGPNKIIIPEKYNEHEIKLRIMKDKVKTLMSKVKEDDKLDFKESDSLINNVHIFYYAPVHWFKSTSHLNGSSSVSNLNVNFYPQLGLYNTTIDVLKTHFQDIKNTGVGVIALNWFKSFPHNLLNNVFSVANSFNLKISIQIDEYPDRTVESIRNDVKYFYSNFGLNKGLNRVFVVSKNLYLPLFYIKETFTVGEVDWTRLLSKNGDLSIRSEYDGIFLGQVNTSDQKVTIRRAKFDGFYSSVVSNGATYSSTWKNWNSLNKFAIFYNLIFVPTVGPGYEDKKKQTRSGGMRRHRSNGNYYGVAWRTAIQLNPTFISIASYNNWVEGTQIERAIPIAGFRDYNPSPSNKYIELTQFWLEEYVKSKVLTHLKCEDFFNNTIC